MKLFFSLLFLSQVSHAGLINIYFEKDEFFANEVKKIFISKYSVPEKLINIKKKTCETKVDSRFLNLCITKKGELIKLPSYLKFIRKSLKTFKTSPNKREA